MLVQAMPLWQSTSHVLSITQHGTVVVYLPLDKDRPEEMLTGCYEGWEATSSHMLGGHQHWSGVEHPSCKDHKTLIAFLPNALRQLLRQLIT